MDARQKRERIVVITGGSSGIGREIAGSFTRNGDQAVIIGRREDALAVAAQAIGERCTWQRGALPGLAAKEMIDAAGGAHAPSRGQVIPTGVSALELLPRLVVRVFESHR